MNGSDLTICSVLFGDRHWLDCNLELTQRLNPGSEARWRVAVNEPVQPGDDVQGPPSLDLVAGAALSEHERADPLYRSLHHAKGLQRAVAGVTTRWLLVIDADCFVVLPEWIESVLGYMEAAGLAFFGTPYHPRSVAKIRYFPCAVCLFVDLERVDLATLDFMAEPGEADSRSAVDSVARRLFERLDMPLRGRPELSRDTGFRIYRRYRGDAAFPAACVTPVMTVDDTRGMLRDPVQLSLERVLPDRWSLLPRGPEAFVDRTFASMRYPDFHARGCEEYLWRGEPFAVHLRGADEQLQASPAKVRAMLDGFRR